MNTTERRTGSHINREPVRRAESPFGDTVDYALTQFQVAGALGELLNAPSVLRMPDLENAFLTGVVVADIRIQALDREKQNRARGRSQERVLTYVGGTQLRDSIASEMLRVAPWDPDGDPDGAIYLKEHRDNEHYKMVSRAEELKDEGEKNEALERANVLRRAQTAMIEFYLTSQEQKRREDAERK